MLAEKFPTRGYTDSHGDRAFLFAVIEGAAGWAPGETLRLVGAHRSGEPKP